MNTDELVLVTGAGGVIGGPMIAPLRAQSFKQLRGAHGKPMPPWDPRFSHVENLSPDLKDPANCYTPAKNAGYVFNLAADMGGMGFIEANKAKCMLSVLISTHMLQAARDNGCKRFFYSSSACVYNASRQTDPNVTALVESDAYPALPEDG